MNTDQTRRHGFTMMEILAVAVILVILATLVIGVSRYVYSESCRKETEATQRIVMQAVESYYAEWAQDVYPPSGASDDVSMETLFIYLTGKGFADGKDNSSVPAVLKSRDLLSRLPKTAYQLQIDKSAKDGW